MPYKAIFKVTTSKLAHSYVGLTEQGQSVLLSEQEALQHPDKLVELEDGVLMPGLMDTHIHGHGGYDFSTVTSVEEVRAIMLAIGKTGVAYAFATLVSLDQSNLENAIKLIDAYVAEEEINPTVGAAIITGIHLEGPWISEKCKGAHDETVLRKDIDYKKDIEPLLKAASHVNCWKMTFSPDIQGARKFIEEVRDRIELDGRVIQFTVSLGHTNADLEALNTAIANGANCMTHLGNACCEKAARCETEDECQPKSNLVTAFLNAADADKPVVAEVIADGRHTSALFVSHIFKQSNGRIMLVSDSLGPSGLKNGCYKLGTLDVWKKDSHFFIINNPSLTSEMLFQADEATLQKLMRDRDVVLAGSAVSLKEVMQEYYHTLEAVTSDESERVEAIFNGAVDYPRKVSRCEIPAESEAKNFVLMQHGKVLLSCVQGQTHIYDGALLDRQYYRKHLEKPMNYPVKVLFECKGKERVSGPKALNAIASIQDESERLYATLQFLSAAHRLFPGMPHITQRNFTISLHQWSAVFEDKNLLKTALHQLRRVYSHDGCDADDKRFAYAFLNHDHSPQLWKAAVASLMPHHDHAHEVEASDHVHAHTHGCCH